MLRFIRLCFIVSFTNLKFVATLCGASLSIPFFQQHFLFVSLGHILVILAVFQTLHQQRLWLAKDSENGQSFF